MAAPIPSWRRSRSWGPELVYSDPPYLHLHPTFVAALPLHHHALAARRGYKRALAPDAHKMLRIIYVVLKTGRPYYDRTADYDALMVKRNAPRWIPMPRRYGYIKPVDAELQAA